jgi:hypothetical protein
MKEISVHPESGIDIDGGRRRRIGWAQETELSYRVFIIPRPRPHKGDEYPITRTPHLAGCPSRWAVHLACVGPSLRFLFLSNPTFMSLVFFVM